MRKICILNSLIYIMTVPPSCPCSIYGLCSLIKLLYKLAYEKKKKTKKHGPADKNADVRLQMSITQFIITSAKKKRKKGIITESTVWLRLA